MEFIVILLSDEEWFIHSHDLQQDAEREVAKLIVELGLAPVEINDLSEYYRSPTARVLYIVQPKQENDHAEE